ncbi:DNA polymerase III subunit delta [Buchnera aphidicola (Pemphigus obesinymphae)]|uniref:DNA polymerase III subunit delta n=1 Tax=Buchnera aphidicola TaxID=9 RepID=UPI0022370B4A|nr:DNA polymerase III subunit delta [Buchnera aphidicola]MCW5196356.1 DNA polymerase III subunit delta [Buchnera aphidicola (Pemphigus obesinymphae)]
MHIINADNLEKSLLKKLNYSYLLIGEEEFFIQESKIFLLKFAKKKQYLEINTVYIKFDIDWINVIKIYQKMCFFSKKKILILKYKKNTFDNEFFKNLKKISNILNENIFLIMQLENHNTDYQKKIFLNLSQINVTIIYCNKITSENWNNWIEKKIKKMQLNMHNDVKKLLYKNYEGNLFALSNILNILMLLYSSNEITLNKSKKIIENLSLFTPVEWINSLFEKNKKRSMKIINRFSEQKYNPVVLIRHLQKDLLTLIYMKKNKNINYYLFLNKKKICNKRHIIFINACINNTDENLYKIIKIITNLELKIKGEYNDKSLWTQLKLLSLQFCYYKK